MDVNQKVLPEVFHYAFGFSPREIDRLNEMISLQFDFETERLATRLIEICMNEFWIIDAMRDFAPIYDHMGSGVNDDYQRIEKYFQKRDKQIEAMNRDNPPGSMAEEE